MATIAITGASGKIGTNIRPLLAAAGHTVRLFDLNEPAPAPGGNETFEVLDSTDLDASTRAFQGADLLVHFAAFASERSWPDISRVNLESAYVAHEAALRSGVRRVLAASSVHAVGFSPVSDLLDDPQPQPRPDTFYGVSKVLLEALGSLYADQFGQSVVSARIMTAETEPVDVRSLSTWLSPADTARLVEAALALPLDAPGPSHHVVWGVSDNTRRAVSLAAGHAIGFVPVDDAEAYSDRFPDARQPASVDPSGLIGGTYPAWPLGEPMQ